MKRIIACFLVLIISLSLLMSGCVNKSNIDYIINDSENISIGVILPLSDDYESLGINYESGINYASQLANKVQLDKQYSLELEFYDSNDDIDTVASELISKKVCAVICCGSNKERTDAIITAFDGVDLPLVFLDNYSDSIINAKNAFSISLSADYQCTTVASHLLGEGYKSGAVVCTADDNYSVSFAEKFESTFNGYGGQGVSKYYRSGEGANFSAKTISAAGVDFVFLIGNTSDNIEAYNELISAGCEAQILFSEVFDKTELEKSEYNNVAFLSNFEPDDNNYIGSDFINNYSDDADISNGDVTAATAYGYDAYMMIYEAIHSFNPYSDSPLAFATEASSSSENDTAVYTSELIDAIQNIEYNGVTDTLCFSEYGLVKATFVYMDSIMNSQVLMLSRYDYNYE